MREFTKSMMSYTWALSVFSAQQVINLFAPGQGSEQTAKAKQAFDNITDATTGTFNQTLKNMFGAGDKLQQGMVDVLLGGLSSGSLDPSRWIQMGNDAIKQVADLGRRSVPSVTNVAPNARQTAAPSESSTPGVSAAPQDVGWGPMPGR
jgi:hypothetical protein